MSKELHENKNNVVNHPSHYCTGKYECIDVMMEVFGVEAVKIFCQLNAFKYNYRSGRKNGKEDLEKAIWYTQKYLELCKLEDVDEEQNQNASKNPKNMQLYIVELSDGQPDWNTAEPFDEIKTIEITELSKESAELDMSQRLKQHHYDETHSRKANWNKRYF